MSLLLSGPSPVTAWLEEAAFLAIQGKPYSQRPRLVQVIRRSTLRGREVLYVHDGKTSVEALIAATHTPNMGSEAPPPIECSISRGCIVRINNWVVSSRPSNFPIPTTPHDVESVLDGGGGDRVAAIICLQVENVELLGGHGTGIVGDAIDVNESVDVRRALMSIQHNPQVLMERLRQTTTSDNHQDRLAVAPSSSMQTQPTAKRPAHPRIDNEKLLPRETLDLWDDILQQAQRDRDKSPQKQNVAPTSILRRRKLSSGDQAHLNLDQESLQMKADKHPRKVVITLEQETSDHISLQTVNEQGLAVGESHVAGLQEGSVTARASCRTTVLGDVNALLKGELQLSVDDVLIEAGSKLCHKSRSENGGSDGTQVMSRELDIATNTTRSEQQYQIDSDILENVAGVIEDKVKKANCPNLSSETHDATVEAEIGVVARPCLRSTTGVAVGDVRALLDSSTKIILDDAAISASQPPAATNRANLHRFALDNENPQESYSVQEKSTSQVFAKADCRSDTTDLNNDDESSESDDQSEVVGISAMLASQDDDHNSTTLAAMEQLSQQQVDYLETQPALAEGDHPALQQLPPEDADGNETYDAVPGSRRMKEPSDQNLIEAQITTTGIRQRDELITDGDSKSADKMQILKLGSRPESTCKEQRQSRPQLVFKNQRKDRQHLLQEHGKLDIPLPVQVDTALQSSQGHNVPFLLMPKKRPNSRVVKRPTNKKQKTLSEPKSLLDRLVEIFNQGKISSLH